MTLAALALSLLLAPAAPPPAMAPAFANTIVSTYPDGRTARLWLEPDGAYRATGRRGRPSSGRWTYKAGKVCLKQSQPKAIPFRYCAPMREGGVGTSWTAKAVTGEPITIRVVAGR